ncbi:MAG TPA: Mur ligase domain-containing protein [Elusimicrobiales bacterium]|nr:Mur ligase domain-containing protein [Elusimicrobiales bacterium]
MRKTIHFSGIGGVGMSALAQIAAMEGRSVSGSDRDFDRGRNTRVRAALEALGVKIYPQDGSGVNAATAELALSTAIEDSNPEVLRAKELGVKISHRSELLAGQVDRFDSIVVAGTSGKSTAAAMLFAVLDAAGLGPSIITGGALVQLQERGLIGNAFRGKGNILVVEADESDGSIVRYKPKTGVLLNISKDHKELPELNKIFLEFAGHCGRVLVNADDAAARALLPAAPAFGFDAGGWKVENVRLEPFLSRFLLNGLEFVVPAPGLYNIENALAACAAAALYGAAPEAARAGLANFRGVERRFRLVGEKNGVKVVDDFAHNPAKVSAVLKALRLAGGGRVFAVYQPHGFAPTRHLRAELIQAFVAGLAGEDTLVMPEIYYAGGTAAKDISSKDITGAVAAAGRRALFFADRGQIPGALAGQARPGDIIAVMGARDATLSDFARQVLEALP